MTMEEKVAKLHDVRKMESPEDIELFEDLVWGLSQTQKPEVLEKLLDVFDDDCPFPEVMYNLVHAIETYPVDIYVKALVSKIPYGINSYPMWLEELCNRVWNDEKYYTIFKKYFYIVSKKDRNKLLDKIEKESPHHQSKVDELKALFN